MSEIDDLRNLVDANQNYNVEAHVILQTGIDNERVMRIAGDAASLDAVRVVNSSLVLTESRLSQEALDRSAGDLVSDKAISDLTARFVDEWDLIQQDAINFKIKTNADIVRLDGRIDATNLAIEVQRTEIDANIESRFSYINNRVLDLQKDVDRYLVLLQDITMDSAQITMDNGEINMGAWTILSQAREWDLEILNKLKNYMIATDENISKELENIKESVPNTQQVINEALEALSNAPIIQDLDDRISNNEVTIDGVTQTVMEHKIQEQEDIIRLSQDIANKVKAESDARAEQLQNETQDRIDAIRRETVIRTQQILELDDGLTLEIQERIDGDNKAYELIENLKVSNDEDYANVLRLIQVNTDNISANSTAITQLDARLVVTDANANTALSNSATALEKANTAITETQALAESLNTVTATIEDIKADVDKKVDATVFNSLKADVERIDGVTTANSSSITAINSDISSIKTDIQGNATAINALTVEQQQMNGVLTQQVQDMTTLKAQVATIDGSVAANTSAISSLTARVDQQGQDITSISNATTSLENKLNGIALGGTNLIRNSSQWLGDPLAGAEGIQATYSSGRDVLFVWASAGNNGWLTNFFSWDQIKFINETCNQDDDVIFSVDFYIESGSTPDGPSIYWKDAMAYQKLILVPGQELRYDGWYRFYQTRKYVKGEHAFHFNFSGMTGTYRLRNPVVEKGNKPSMWKQADADFASSSALASLQSEVSVIDGKVTATASDLVTLKSTVDANQAYILNNYYTKTDTDQVIANQVTTLKSEIGKIGRNYVRNTAVERKGINWVFEDKLTAKLSEVVTISFDYVELSGTPAGGGVGFNHGKEGNEGYYYYWYPNLTTGHHTWTGVVDTGDMTHFGIYSNTACIIKNVKVEKGSIATEWSIAPEDIEVGARNIIRNSSFAKDGAYWSNYAADVTFASGELINGKPAKWAYIHGAGTDGGIYVQPSQATVTAKLGDMMTISFWARGNGGILYGFDDAYDTTEVVPTEWRYITKTFRRLRSDNIIFYRRGATYLDVAFPKVEMGTKATEWTPAPEDVEESVSALATATSTLTTKVTELDGVISTQASQIVTLTSFKNDVVAGGIPGNKVVGIDLRDPSYDQNTYYPVSLSSFSTMYRQTLRLMATLNSVSHPTWATHSAGFSLNLQWQTSGNGWGTIGVETVVDNFAYSFTDGQSPVMKLYQFGTSSQPYFLIRGGGYYELSLPSEKSIYICPPNGNITNPYGEVVYPEAYNSTLVPVSVAAGVQSNKVTLQQTNEVQDGIRAVSTVSVDNNGWISGYGLISQLVNGVVTSAFGVNADYFYVGNGPSTAKKPFMVLTTPQTIGGVTYPAGTWMDVAVIANATIGSAHIAFASITNAHIVDLNAEKITAGIISADRIGANTITAEKLIVGDTTNLWVNQYFNQNGPKLETASGRTQWNGGIAEITSHMGVQLWGRDHVAPYSTKIPLKPGDTFMIEYVAGMNAGPGAALGVGLWVYDSYGNVGSTPFQYGGAAVIADLGGGWYRWRRTFQVWDNGTGMKNGYGCLYFQIEQDAYATNPTYWTVGDVIIRKPVGGELIVNGSVTADKLYSNTVSGMFANFGEFTATQPDGTKTKLTGGGLYGWYSNGNPMFKLGI